MTLQLIDFVVETDGVDLEDFPPDVQDRINDELAELTGGDGGPGSDPDDPPQSIIVDAGGDGDYESIQTAISEKAESGDVIFVEPGEYDESVTVNVEDLTLEGPNAGIAGDSDERGAEANVSGYVAVDAEQVTIDGFAIEREASGSLTQKGVIQMGAVGDSASGSTIANNIITPNDTNSENPRLGGVAIESADNVTISDNVISPADGSADTIGITRYVSNIENLTVSSNMIETSVAISFGGGKRSYSASITDNEFDSVATGITVNEAGSLDITIADNVFNGGPFYVYSADNEATREFDFEGEKLDLQPILDDQGNTFNTTGNAVITEFEDINSSAIADDNAL
ncbi:hypothetical protein C465_07991 [Halorubrum distributum JCM 9100]|uniref:Right handed beta helix domain-containing protein n=2 Tax=Halorubrum distributum TaxID=29283 RepID=M0EP90_9EURY|nr:right-handed parallel beta-helix repeat-containing protein [Halorubrum distributum]ELZ49495.1 hypothetical protein C465_07991 [Halorubrum distributum JCM 9100]ELZ57270.1 hypothetical protein C466_01734 [Halorubrum distributum JCM 10118]